jgi:hypothetical protein
MRNNKGTTHANGSDESCTLMTLNPGRLHKGTRTRNNKGIARTNGSDGSCTFITLNPSGSC